MLPTTKEDPRHMASTSESLFIGLRRSPLEWRAELAAAKAAGLVPHVTSDADLGHTELPSDCISKFTWSSGPAVIAEEIVRSLTCKPSVVACWGDRFVEPTAHVAAALGLRGTGREAAAVCCNKAAQRRALEPFGLNPKWRAGSSFDELSAAVHELPHPLIFKLAHSSGGRGTAFIEDSTDLRGLLGATSLNYVESSAFVVEERVDGSEHSAAGIVCDGEPVVYAIADKVLQAGTIQTRTTLVPSAVGSEQVDRLRAAAEQAVRAVGLKFGGFHVDLRLTARGPIVLEVGGRLGGDLINSHLVPKATGGAFKPYEAFIEVLKSGRRPQPVAYTAAAAMLLVPQGEKRLERLRAHPLVTVASDWPGHVPASLVAVVEANTRASLDAGIADLESWVEG